MARRFSAFSLRPLRFLAEVWATGAEFDAPVDAHLVRMFVGI
jgi:hypothetical protein